MTRTIRWFAFILSMLAPAGASEPVRVVATLPDLGALAQVVGGDLVSVTVLAKPTEDPHFVESRPSYIKALSAADLYVQSGLEMEAGYASVLLTGARNPRILAGQPGWVDASMAITPLDIPVGTVDRSMGDVHPAGNPHYLLDPLNGLAVAALLRDRLSALRPEAAPTFAANYERFQQQLGDALVGPTLARKYGAEKLARLHEHGKLLSFLQQQGDAAALGGWLAAMAPHHGARAVDDHPIWTYFARRFGLDIVGHLEPKPGVPPTTRHLQEIVALMQAEHVPLLLAASYYDPRHAEFVAAQTGAQVVRMANQVGARPGTDDYIGMINYDVEQVVGALKQKDAG